MAFVCQEKAAKAADERKELIKNLKDLIGKVEEECNNAANSIGDCCVPCCQPCCHEKIEPPKPAGQPDWMVLLILIALLL